MTANGQRDQGTTVMRRTPSEAKLMQLNRQFLRSNTKNLEVDELMKGVIQDAEDLRHTYVNFQKQEAKFSKTYAGFDKALWK